MNNESKVSFSSAEAVIDRITEENSAGEQSGWLFFELVEDENNIPFHFSYRPDEKTIVFNSLEDGEWSKEEAKKLPADSLDCKHFILTTGSGNKIELKADGKVILSRSHSTMSFDGLTLRASPDAVTKFKSVTIYEDEAGRFVSADDRKIYLPKKTKTSQFAEKFEKLIASKFLTQISRFAATRVFGRDTKILVSGHGRTLTSVLAAKLFPNSKIFVLKNEDDPAELQQLLKTNEAADVTLLDSSDLSEFKADEVLLIVDLASDEETYKKLCEVASKVHLCASHDVLVPANKVYLDSSAELGNIAVALQGPTTFQLSNHALGGLQRRKPGLDIAVAMYNAKDYIVECVESLLTPGRDDVRVIVVDDGSTDGCEKIVEKHFKDDPRVRVETKANGGCASARNYGRLVSNATHITFVDADDFVDQGFYSSLFDLAAYSGFEIVQGGFDFFDETLDKPYYDSYEEAVFANHPRVSFGERDAIHLDSMELIHGQPTIWRRVYRRDFLDSKNLYFPENIRAYDDYIFHLLTLTYGRSVLMMPDIKYHYRQHPAQDIKKGDERHFYELYMFRMLLKRSVEEGWPNFLTYSQSVVNTINWSSSVLREDLIDTFLQSGARICAIIRKIYGESALPDELLHRVEHPDFMHFFHLESGKMMNSAGGAFWAYIDAPEQHAETVKMLQKLS